MKLSLLLAFLSLSLYAQAQAQSDAQATAGRRETVRYKSPLDADLNIKTAQVEYFSTELKMLKTAFDKNESSRIVLGERNLVAQMRYETQAMEDKVDGEKVQRERRAQAGSGNAVQAGETARPKRDPFADPETVSEQRLEQMRMTLAAFERHSFDPANPEAAKRDFAKLDAFLQILEAELAELKKIKG
ncbi:MAG: hypothetical protein WCR52_10630 [Bacteroidota bacterium]